MKTTKAAKCTCHRGIPLRIREFAKNNEKSKTTKQLDAFYSTHKAIIDNDILQAQYDLLGEEEYALDIWFGDCVYGVCCGW